MIFKKYFFIFSLFLITANIGWSASLDAFSSDKEKNRKNLDNFWFELYTDNWKTFTANEVYYEFIYAQTGHESDLYSVVQNNLVRTGAYLFELFRQKRVLKIALSQKSSDAGDTPLLLAIKAGFVEMVQIMLEGAQSNLSKEDLLDILNITDKYDKNAIECAAKNSNMISIINQAIDSFRQDENVRPDNAPKAKAGPKTRPNKKNKDKSNRKSSLKI